MAGGAVRIVLEWQESRRPSGSNRGRKNALNNYMIIEPNLTRFALMVTNLTNLIGHFLTIVVFANICGTHYPGLLHDTVSVL
ncbi:hypothetical protein CRG98_028387 [Punica granatum]|uniref:Uncharacterized protein n=1 Tax=Punica granatum TaxID=22663 RepID=A0A2I0J4U0_PUNGR|nr:hypothetical protein CRG98_028387 [Punica granatum]